MVKITSFLCDTCGGALQQASGSFYDCPFCGGKKFINLCTDEEKSLILLGDAARRAMRFDEAVENYEAALKTTPQNFNALWGMFLAEYGIEYVKDLDGSYKPTFHRLSRVGVFNNPHVLNALNLLNGEERKKYESDAAAIEMLRAKALSAADRQEPYDIFICYKKTDPNGGLTPEAAWAQDYYTELRALGYKVFWADKSIKPGEEYEPSVYNALYTAKFLIILCTSPEYLNSTWVLNEWSRFVRRKRQEPAINFCVVYENVEPYALPAALRTAQAINHAKIASFGLLKEAIAQTVSGKAESAPAHPPRPVTSAPPRTPKPQKPYNKAHFKARLITLLCLPLVMLIVGLIYFYRFPWAVSAIVIECILFAVFIGLLCYDAKRLFSKTAKKRIASVIVACLMFTFAFVSSITLWSTYSYCDGYYNGFFYHADYAVITDNFDYSSEIGFAFYKGGITLFRYKDKTDTKTDIVIPSHIRGKPVRTLNEFLFVSNTIKSISIPDTVTIIRRSSIGGHNLTSVIFGANSQLEYIGDAAFTNAISLTSINIPASVTYIGEFAFPALLTDIYFAGTQQQWQSAFQGHMSPFVTVHYNAVW
ncbi:MAG: TIR domain-containing protein [Firmicutes bacterium]|nr:TIR domain-containing protein [Bacillota bacterium]